MKNVWFFIIFFTVTLTTASAGFLLAEDFVISISQEDGPIENLNAIIFLVASLTGFYVFSKSFKNRKALLFLSILSLTGFLDELSFGARIFNISVPLIYGASMDAVHDIFYLVMKVIYHLSISYPVYMILFFLLSGILIFLTVYTYRQEILKMIKVLYENKPSFLLASFFSILIFLALMIDLDMIQNNFLYFIEEIFELNASSALLFWILSLKKLHPQVSVSKLSIIHQMRKIRDRKHM